jgi:hypothetical protein
MLESAGVVPVSSRNSGMRPAAMPPGSVTLRAAGRIGRRSAASHRR